MTNPPLLTMKPRFLKILFAATFFLGVGSAARAAPPVDGTDTPAQKGLAGRPVDTAVLRLMPADQVPAVAAWKVRLQDYYRSVQRSQNVYLNFCAELLRRSGLPSELKLICLIESHMNPEARSEDDALGIWQLMPAVALENGLELAPFDERKDIYKSSQVAVRIIQALYKKFGDPLLVVAAYNCGPGRVQTALQTAGASRYWAVRSLLPAETQNHVGKYLAALSIFYNIPLPVAPRPQKVLPVAEVATFSSPVKNEKEGYLTIQITSSYKPAAIVKYTGIAPETFVQLNPDLVPVLAQRGVYDLKLTEPAMQLFLLKKPQILKASLDSE